MFYKTAQENFWSGEFGSDYARRNRGAALEAANLALFARLLRSARGVRSVIEFGANIGLNLKALARLLPEAELAGVEINPTVAAELSAWGGAAVFRQSFLDFVPERRWDLVLAKGVLIHVEPDSLPLVYAALHRSAGRYILLAEYYNPTPVAVAYRGHDNRLFKRDFAGDLLDRFPDLSLVDYGFAYHRDANFPQDDLNWFLLEKG